MSRSPAVKRLLSEFRELQADPSPEFTSAPLEDNMLEWHFTIRGPNTGGFSGGRYHGRMIFPPDYPFKPPNISFLTPNGRFEVGKKICLSITGHHPESWRPAWGIATALVAIISFLPTKGEGAIGALDWTDEERAKCAKKSRSWVCSVCGSQNATALPDESERPSETLEVDPEISLTVKSEGNDEGSSSSSPAGTSPEVGNLSPVSVSNGTLPPLAPISSSESATPSTPTALPAAPPSPTRLIDSGQLGTPARSTDRGELRQRVSPVSRASATETVATPRRTSSSSGQHQQPQTQSYRRTQVDIALGLVVVLLSVIVLRRLTNMLPLLL
ncbi:ubiquitin-conjugating enzyme/RWD-like protein [Cladochytrium replicatum]|nr:ubiquitin-conjugating enzyme/RWD-like protein [Cladochytrium replicatum]